MKEARAACPTTAKVAVERPNGPEVWNTLLAQFAAELDDGGVPWLPRLGGRTRSTPSSNKSVLVSRAS